MKADNVVICRSAQWKQLKGITCNAKEKSAHGITYSQAIISLFVLNVQSHKMPFKNYRATPIYLLVLHAQEVGNEPFWNLKKS